MKQQITQVQLKSLTQKQDANLFAWQRKHGYNKGLRTTLLSIGQMIEFLDEHKSSWHDVFFVCDDSGTERVDYYGNPCDALWEAVKKVLRD